MEDNATYYVKWDNTDGCRMISGPTDKLNTAHRFAAMLFELGMGTDIVVVTEEPYSGE